MATYPVTVSFICCIDSGIWIHLLKIDGWFNASTTSPMHLDTVGCDRFIELLLAMGVW